MSLISAVTPHLESPPEYGRWLGSTGTSPPQRAASFGIVSDAIYSWATSIDSWQTQADTNLNKARLAKEHIASAQTDLASAQSAASTIQGEFTKALRTYNMYQHVEPPSGVKVPTSYQNS